MHGVIAEMSGGNQMTAYMNEKKYSENLTLT